MQITGDVVVGRRISAIMTVASNVARQKETLRKTVKEEKEHLVNYAQNVALAQNVACEGLLAEVLVREGRGMIEHKEPRGALEVAHVVAAIGVDGVDECRRFLSRCDCCN